MKNKLIIAGYLSKSDWGGQVQPREQDFVVDERGCCMSIPATYTRHPFKILTHVEEMVLGYVWKSQQNGAVYDFFWVGYLPALTADVIRELNQR